MEWNGDIEIESLIIDDVYAEENQRHDQITSETNTYTKQHTHSSPNVMSSSVRSIYSRSES